MTEDETFDALEKFFSTTVHGWPCIPRKRARWWQRHDRRIDKQVDAALAVIGRGPYTTEMSSIFWQQVRYGQDIWEDAGGYVWRCWCAALGLPFRAPTCTYSGYMAPSSEPIHIGVDMGTGDDRTAYR